MVQSQGWISLQCQGHSQKLERIMDILTVF